MERLDFRMLLLQSWNASLSKRLPWVFGCIVAVSGIMETRLQTDIPDTVSFDELLEALSAKSIDEWFLLFLILLSLFALGTFGKSNLIAALSFVAGKPNLENSPRTLHAIGKNFLRAFFLESLILLLLLMAAGILSLPLWIASSHNPDAMTPLITLGFLTFLPIAIIIFFIRQYSLLYLLLSPLRIRGAIETAANLFSRFLFPSLLFGVFSLTVTLLFTFLLNLVILSVVALLRQVSVPLEGATISLATGLALFSWFAVFQQALWIAFFRAIAGTSGTEKAVTEKESAFAETNLPETPPAR